MASSYGREPPPSFPDVPASVHNLQVHTLTRPDGAKAGFHAEVDESAGGLHHAGEQWVPPHFMIDTHSHPVWELYLQVHGLTRWMVGSRTRSLHPGDLLAVAPGVRHRLITPTDGNHHFYFAAFDLPTVLLRHPALAAAWADQPESIHCQATSALPEAFAALTRELTFHQPYPHEGITLALDQVVLATTRSLQASAPLPRMSVHPAVAAARDLLDRHCERRWSLADLARHVGLAPTYLAGMFAAEIGQPPHRYLQQRRIDVAKQLLATSDLPVTAIATSLGFASSQHFARAFGQAVAATPTAYRRQQRSVSRPEQGNR